MKKLVVIAMLVLFSTVASAQDLEGIKWFTEEYPPYNYSENGVPTGIAVDTILLMWKKLGLNKTVKDIKVVPWNRGVKTIKTKPNTCLFTTNITAERKTVFGWKYVFPIPQVSEEPESHLIALKKSGIKLNSVDDIKNYDKKYGVVRGDVGEALIFERGVGAHKVDYSSNATSLLKKLVKGRVGIISYAEAAITKIVKKEGFDESMFEIVFGFPPNQAGYAFHHNTDPGIIAKFQKALDEVHEEGSADKILKKFLKK